MNPILAFILLFSTLASGPKAPGKGKWIKLFNGKDLKDWVVKIKGYSAGENFANTFRVGGWGDESGLRRLWRAFKQRYGHIFYKKKFSAYLVVVEYRFTETR